MNVVGRFDGLGCGRVTLDHNGLYIQNKFKEIEN